jgi:hypothetical protein
MDKRNEAPEYGRPDTGKDPKQGRNEGKLQRTERFYVIGIFLIHCRHINKMTAESFESNKNLKKRFY